MDEWRERFGNWVKSLPTKQKLLIGIAVGAGAIAILYQLNWSGFGPDSNKSVSTEEAINSKDGKIVKLNKETVYFQSGKTLWDWLQLVGTLAIPIVLFQFDLREQKRAKAREDAEKKQAEERIKEEKKQAEALTEAEKRIADNNLREQALEAYMDRMSNLLLDKNLKTLASDDPLRDTALDVARARTLSVLRRLHEDGERKGSIIRFLIDAELIDELNLSDANLHEADLSGADLKRANFSGADLSGADLNGAKLREANLHEADLSGVDLRSTNLVGAELRGSKIDEKTQIDRKWHLVWKIVNQGASGLNLSSEDLSGANLSEADLSGANLSGANLSGADLTSANLEGAILSKETILPDNSKYQSKDQLAKFTNLDIIS